MSKRTPVNPDVLRWARETAGMSAEDLAKKLNQKETTIKDWESGKGRPRYAQLEKLAKRVRRPVAVFYFPEPPPEASLTEQFRSLPPEATDVIPPEIRFLIRDGRVKQMSLQELLGDDMPSPSILSLSGRSPKELVKRTRARLGISLEDQIACEDADAAVKMWRDALEACGVWIFKDAFGDDDYCGFCLHDERFPLIMLNNSMAKTRQIFTLFHELGHLLRGKGGIDLRTTPEWTGSYREEEVFCNAFAAAFLVPDESLGSDLKSDPSAEEIGKLAQRYHVSREVILRKFLDNEQISKAEYESRREKWKEDWTGKRSGKGGNYYATQYVYRGRKYLQLVFQRYHQQKIDARQLVDYLGVKPRSLQAFEDYVLERWEE